MSMPATPKRHWSIQEVERLTAARPGYTPRYELANGELLVTPSPTWRHQRIVGELFLHLRPYVDRVRIGEARLGPGAVRLDARSYFEPDLCVVPAVDNKRPRSDATVDQLLLAVEVLSPGSIRHDRITKRRYYQQRGVPEYWVVDGEAEAIEVWRPNDERPLVVDDRLVWSPNAREAFVLDVREFFASVSDD